MKNVRKIEYVRMWVRKPGKKKVKIQVEEIVSAWAKLWEQGCWESCFNVNQECGCFHEGDIVEEY